jgi:hypothetical protein
MDSQQRLGDAVVRAIIDGYEYVSARSVHTLPARTHDKLVVPESQPRRVWSQGRLLCADHPPRLLEASFGKRRIL